MVFSLLPYLNMDFDMEKSLRKGLVLLVFACLLLGCKQENIDITTEIVEEIDPVITNDPIGFLVFDPNNYIGTDSIFATKCAYFDINGDPDGFGYSLSSYEEEDIPELYAEDLGDVIMIWDTEYPNDDLGLIIIEVNGELACAYSNYLEIVVDEETEDTLVGTFEGSFEAELHSGEIVPIGLLSGQFHAPLTHH